MVENMRKYKIFNFTEIQGVSQSGESDELRREVGTIIT